MNRSTTRKRRGVGQPALYGMKMPQVTVTIPRPYVDILREIGGGNTSAGVRKLVEDRLKAATN